MKKQKDGEPAFPIDLRLESRADKVLVYGMSLRDYFASAIVAAGISSSREFWDDNEMVRDAYRLADLMLELRGRKTL